MNIDFVTEQLVKENALSKFRDDRNMAGTDFSTYPSIEQANVDANKALRELIETTQGELKEKIYALEDKMSDLGYVENEENFVHGFVSGFFFLKQILESNGKALA